MPGMKKYILTLIFFILFIDLYAQEEEIRFTHITTEDGLSANGVTKILQDSRGFLWFGTYNGLQRYDGYNFKVFLPEPSNPYSISSHSIVNLNEDSKGDIWVATSDGLNRFDWKTEKFYRYKNNPNDSNSLSSNYVYTVFEDESNTLWIGTLHGLNRYNREKDNFTVIENIYIQKYGGTNSSVTSISEDENGNLWLGTWSGLLKIQKNGKLINQFIADEKNPLTISIREIATIHEDDFNNLWIGTNGKGLEIYNPKTGSFTRYITNPNDPNTISSNYINTIYQDKLNNIWVGTKNGLNKFDREKNKFVRIFHSQFKSYSLINDDILSIAEDKTGIIWIGTTGGISKFYQSNYNFKKYQTDGNYSGKSFEDQRVNYLYQDRKDNLWVCTKAGLHKIEPGGKGAVHYYNNPLNTNSLSNNYIKTILEDHSGTIWIGTDGGGLNKFNPSTGKFKIYKYNANDPNCISNDGITSLYEDSNNDLWIGTYWGLNRFDRRSEKFYWYVADPPKPNGLLNHLIWVIHEDSKGMIWLGTDGGGVSMFNPKNDTFKNFVVDSANTKNISGNIIISILETRDGIMWFGSHKGLNSYNRKTGEFTVYDENNGILSPIINSIEEDDKGNLWIGTDKSLSKFNRKSVEFTNYTRRNGIVDVEFSPGASIKDKDGKFFFGTNKGFIFFDPDNLKDIQFVAPVVITDFKIYNQSVPISSDGILTESIVDAKSLKIPFSSDVITFDFALLDYFNVKKNQFSYMLIGFDNKWNNIGNRNNATYTNLPPGEYSFLVKAASEGVRSENEASLQIIIVPAYYQTWWFKLLAGIMLFLAIVLFMNLRTKKIKNQNKILEKNVAERTKDIAESSKELKSINIKLQNENKERLLAENTLKHYNSRLEAFDKIYRGIISARSVDEIIKETLVQMPILFNFIDTATVALIDLKSDLVIVNKVDFNPNLDLSFSTIKIPINHDVFNDKTNNLNHVYYENDIRLVQNKLPIDRQLLSRGFLSYLAAPLVIDNNRIGNLSVSAKKTGVFNDNHKEVLLVITNQLSVAINQAQLQSKIKEHSQSLQNSLSEKEILLKEIHHRVKNNLQVISSLLYLNSKKVKSKEALNMFKDSQNRVKSIALVHERLYQSKDLGKIDFKEYIQKLTNDLFRSYGVNLSVINLKIDINNVFISIDTAVPCGLIINEIISNSLKYAFPDYEDENKSGLININFSKDEMNKWVLVVGDNGIGIPEEAEEKKKNSLGLQLIDTLVAQLDGTLEIDLSSGTAFVIKFKDEKSEK
jgi:two-component sensor histidine kinase/ligand-binding sensor domain-containing protein